MTKIAVESEGLMEQRRVEGGDSSRQGVGVRTLKGRRGKVEG